MLKAFGLGLSTDEAAEGHAKTTLLSHVLRLFDGAMTLFSVHNSPVNVVYKGFMFEE